MAAGIVLPAWKRFNAQFIRPEDLSLSDKGSKDAFDAMVSPYAQVLAGKEVIGNVDGYLATGSGKYGQYLSLAPIDAGEGRSLPEGMSGLMKIDTAGRGKFHAMDESFLELDKQHGKGFYLHLQKDMPVPVVEFLGTIRKNGMLVHHDRIVLEPGTHLTLLRIIDGRGGVVADNTEVYAGKGSRLAYIILNRSGKGTFYAAIKQVRIAERARVDWYTVDLSESHAALSLRSLLAGPGAETGMTGVLIGKADAQKDVSYETFHTAPDTSTSVYVRAALMDSSRITYRALTHIASGSKRAKVEQAAKSLTLGDKAKFDGIPSLWIDENDVTASHSATSGMVDEETMFYLKSRGIPHEQAEKLVTDGFISSMLNKEPVSLLKGFY